MSLYQHIASSQVRKQRLSVLPLLDPTDIDKLDQLLDLTMIKVLANTIAPAKRPAVLAIIRADATRLPIWLDQQYPSTRLAINEALTRILLSLTVE